MLRRRTQKRWFGVGSVVTAMMLFGTGLSGQTAYTVANNQTSLIPFRHGYVSADFAEVKLALTFMVNHDLGCSGAGCVPDRLNAGFYTSVAARKGQHGVFSSLDFNPGYDIGGRAAYVFRRAGSGYDLVFLGAMFTGQQRAFFTFDPVAQTVTLDEDYQHTFALAVGFNHAFSDVTMVGIGLEGRRELSTPGTQAAQEHCSPGTSPTGVRGVVCSDRFLGPLSDLWTGHVRADVGFRIADLGSAPRAPKLGILSAASVDFVQDARTAFNVAAGPALHLAGYAAQPIVSLLLGLRDVFPDNPIIVNGEQPSYLGDHFVVRLTLGVPFEILAGS